MNDEKRIVRWGAASDQEHFMFWNAICSGTDIACAGHQRHLICAARHAALFAHIM
jgi:hypothetical protein